MYIFINFPIVLLVRSMYFKSNTIIKMIWYFCFNIYVEIHNAHFTITDKILVIFLELLWIIIFAIYYESHSSLKKYLLDGNAIMSPKSDSIILGVLYGLFVFMAIKNIDTAKKNTL